MTRLMTALGAVYLALFAFSDVSSAKESTHLAIVAHHWQAKVVESNFSTLRVGSVYDMMTYFEQDFGVRRPTFSYLFFDTGLGTADPLYPIFQKGYQGSWRQLLPSFLSEKNRHIDHFSSLPTPEGCQVDAIYLVRHIDEFPDRYHEERAAGYTLVDIGFDYYTRLRPDAECGRHATHAPDPNFNAFKALKPYIKKFKSLNDIPKELLSKYEAKIGLLNLVREEFGRNKWPRFKDVYTQEKNSLWYYPNAYPEAYGINQPRPQMELTHLNRPKHLIIPATEELAKALPLDRMLADSDFGKYLAFMNGKPTENYNPATEPGKDAFSVDQITPSYFYTSGLEVVPMGDVKADISNPENYRLSSLIVRPYEPETDARWSGERILPQVRLVYQLMNSRNLRQPVEQVYLHLIWDGVDRHAPRVERDQQHQVLLRDFDALTAVRENMPGVADSATAAFIWRHTRRPLQTLSFSSSLTGIWVFGSLSRSFNLAGEFEAVRIIREGIDVGYYSTAYDSNLFREELKKSKGERKRVLARHLQDLTPRFYRDTRRHNPHSISFNRVTCAQCHQMSARDGVHIGINDHLDRRIKDPTRVSEYTFREVDRQLEFGQGYWKRD